MTHTTIIKGNWDEQKIKLRKRFEYLEDNDVEFEEGKESQMLDRLQLKLGKTRANLLVLIESL
jgi:hypothetical protein